MTMKKANEAVSPSVVGTAADAVAGSVIKSAKTLQQITRLASRKSIMTMAKPGMYVYPIVASSSIDTETLMAIAKSYQLTYASSVATAYSLNPIAYLNDIEKDGNLTPFLQKFHTNSDSIVGHFNNFNLDAAAGALGVEQEGITDDDKEFDITLEATVDRSFSQEDLYLMNVAMDEDVEDALTMESLNDMYRPYDRSYRIMNEKLDSMKKASEDFSDFVDDVYKTTTSNGNYRTGVPIQGGSATTYARDKNGNVIYNRRTKLDENGNPVVNSNGKKIVVCEPQVASVKTSPNLPIDTTAKVIQNQKLDNMEPTMINVNIICHGCDPNNKKNTIQFPQSLTIGVKTAIRLINSNLMIASMVEACKDSKAIFKFLKFTKGEIGTFDHIFGVSASKKKALERNAKQEVKFMKQAAARRKTNMISKFLKNEYLPTLSVVLTTYEVEMIKQACHVDLNQIKDAVRLMNKYYLLSIAIYDPDQDTMKFLFDADVEWGTITVGTMKSLANKITDVYNANAIAQLSGRR